MSYTWRRLQSILHTTKFWCEGWTEFHFNPRHAERSVVLTLRQKELCYMNATIALALHRLIHTGVTSRQFLTLVPGYLKHSKRTQQRARYTGRSVRREYPLYSLWLYNLLSFLYQYIHFWKPDIVLLFWKAWIVFVCTYKEAMYWYVFHRGRSVCMQWLGLTWMLKKESKEHVFGQTYYLGVQLSTQDVRYSYRGTYALLE
jgi:hypothetical protein